MKKQKTKRELVPVRGNITKMTRHPTLPQTHPCWDMAKLSWQQGCSDDEVSLSTVQSDRGSYNRSVNRGGRTYSSCTMLREDRRNPGPPTGNWQSGGGCQWAAMVRRYTNSWGARKQGLPGRGSPSCMMLLALHCFLFIQIINVSFSLCCCSKRRF